MQFVKHEIEGVFEIFPRVFDDKRGYFFESFRDDLFKQNGITVDFVQDNESLSSKGVLRGLHFQKPPFAQDKLVRVINGAVLDVIVDIRKSSPTYGKHATFVVDAKRKNMVFVPKGMAHGFLTLEDHTVFSYKCSDVYNKESESGLLWNDPLLNIDWGVADGIISDKDREWSGIKDFDSPFD